MLHDILFFILTYFIITIPLFFIVIFGLSRLAIPNLNNKIKIPAKLPHGMQEKIDELKKLSHDKRDYLFRAYNYLSQKYKGIKGELWKDTRCLFWTLDDAWSKEGFMTCTMQSYLMIVFLVKSGFFQVKDIKKKHMFYSFNIHQYIKVRLDDKWITVDIWSNNYGVKLGERAKFF